MSATRATKRVPAQRAPAGRAPAKRAVAARPATKRPARARPPAPRAPGRVQRAAGGDRPYFLALLVLLVLLGAMAVGPLQSYNAAAQRVDELTASRDELQAGVDELDARRERLEDPESLELLAREEFGLVMPGEVPYVVLTPEPELDALRPPSEAPAEPPAAAWWDRVWQGVRRLLER